MAAVSAALAEVAEVLAHGDEKHGMDAWRNSDALATSHALAVERHNNRWMAGQQRELESGKRHMAHVAARALIALQLEIDRENGD